LNEACKVAGTTLVVSGRSDPTAAAVVAELARLSIPTARIDIGDFPLHMTMEARLLDGKWRTILFDRDQTIDLTEV
jgi:hypothetical protein